MVLENIKSMLAPGGVAYVSTPNLLTLAPEGAEKSGNPWHVKEYRAQEFRELCAAHFASVELYGLFHARKLRVHELAIKARLGPAAPRLALHQAVLRPLRAGDLDARLRPALRAQPRPRAGLPRGAAALGARSIPSGAWLHCRASLYRTTPSPRRTRWGAGDPMGLMSGPGANRRHHRRCSARLAREPVS